MKQMKMVKVVEVVAVEKVFTNPSSTKSIAIPSQLIGPQDEERVEDEHSPACECGWDGQVNWRAHGQKCPNCGTPLT